MPKSRTVKPTQKAVLRYYAELDEYSQRDVRHEMAVRSAFQNLLVNTAKPHHWFLVADEHIRVQGKEVVPDGTLRDDYNLHRGYWEAKDTDDDLDKEIRKKIAKGYPLTNIIFEDTRQGVLFQNGHEVEPRFDLTEPRQLCDLLNRFYAYTEPDIEGFEQAVDEFKERVPELAAALDKKIKAAHTNNAAFQKAFQNFFAVCQQSLNPNISRVAVDEMLIQHLLTERLIRKIFDRQDFVRRNVIAAEVEKVIDALTAQAFSRHDFLKSLDRFYRAIELAAANLEEFSDKQHFLNTIYEQFFQGYSVKVADTHGIVYTPQEIVDFMSASVAEVLEKEFGLPLGSPGVNILDPCTGTGNFIANLMRKIPKRNLPRMYRQQLFANEVMLMPYYIASLNIEHAYFEWTGTYKPFEGLCFVDTLDLAGDFDPESGKFQKTIEIMTEENTRRVDRQRKTPITVILGNPPYNLGQQNANDNNKNRQYKLIEKRIKDSYAKKSKATNLNKLSDVYVKFFRWAADRLQGRSGIVCFVSNNGFLKGAAFDGFRRKLREEFDGIYHFDLKGNARTSGERRRREGGNIFHDRIRVGIGITLLFRGTDQRDRGLNYYEVGDYWSAENKKQCLRKFDRLSVVPWKRLTPDSEGSWFPPEHTRDFGRLMQIGAKDTKASSKQPIAVFKSFTIGVITSRDSIVYDFAHDALVQRIEQFVEDYNVEVFRYQQSGSNADVDNFVRYDRIQWSRDLKKDLQRGRYAKFSGTKVRYSAYRPFCKRLLYFDPLLNQDVVRWPEFLPTPNTEHENKIIAVTGIASEKPFMTLAITNIADFHLVGAACTTQCFPFYVYDKDGSNRRENITDWALEQFRTAYADESITKWDIFYYVYGILHHPGYRQKFADNLKRELPRIPLAADFRAFADAGSRLAEQHLNYEQLEPYSLDWIETPDVPLSYRVEKMKLSKDKTSLAVNDSLTLGGIPPEVFDYRLGNRSALDWVIDQYRVKTDKRSGITSDPNRADDPEYIVRLVGQVVQVSVETVKIVESLPREYEGSVAATRRKKRKN